MTRDVAMARNIVDDMTRGVDGSQTRSSNAELTCGSSGRVVTSVNRGLRVALKYRLPQGPVTVRYKRITADKMLRSQGMGRDSLEDRDKVKCIRGC